MTEKHEVYWWHPVRCHLSMTNWFLLIQFLTFFWCPFFWPHTCRVPAGQVGCQTHREVRFWLNERSLCATVTCHCFSFMICFSIGWAYSCKFSFIPAVLPLSHCLFVNCGFSSCQWMGDRVTASQSTSLLYSSPSPSSEWSARRQERSSPLRGPHGKFVSPSSVCGYASSTSSPLDQNTPQRSRGERHTDMAELAKHVSQNLEAWIESFKTKSGYLIISEVVWGGHKNCLCTIGTILFEIC